MERQEGYYWVKQDGFMIAEYKYGSFWLTMDEVEYNETDFEFINENRIKQPGELPE